MKTKYYILPLLLLSIFACSKNKDEMNNPLLAKYNTPRETTPFDKISTEQIRISFDTAFSQARREIEQIVQNKDEANFENTIEALDYSGELVGVIAHLLFNLNAAETNDSIQELARDISPKLTEFSNDITLNTELFKKVNYVVATIDKKALSPEQQMLLDNTYKQFVRNGANLSEEDKEKYRVITNELSELSVTFNENVLAETNAFILHITDSSELAGLPDDAITGAREEAESRELEGWIITLKIPSFVPFLKYAENRELRKELNYAYSSRCMHGNENDNQEIIKRIANLRLEEAKLLGYKSYAAYTLENRMAKTPETVLSFLNELGEAYVQPARSEVEEVSEFAKSLGFDDEIQRWDWSFYSEKLRKEKYDLDEEMTRPYFQLENVQEGIFELVNTLYGISITENKKIPVYHADVKAFEVFDENNDFLAVLYLDFFPREGKRQGAWMTEYKQQYTKEGIDHRPQISLVFNFSKPTGKKPSLLTYRELRTFLHEFGHAMHGMFSHVTYSSLAGTNVYRDFVELPSQIMENWAEQDEWLNIIAKHYETGEAIPEELLRKIMASKNYNTAYAGARQLAYGTIDMAWHNLEEPTQLNVQEFEHIAMSKVDILPTMEGTAASPGFGHIFGGGYAAGYYGYKWAEVLDADAFSLFMENGIFDRVTAMKFRDNILAKGGTEDPMALYVNFRGHEPNIDPLLEREGLTKKQ